MMQPVADTLEVASPAFKSWEMNYVFSRVRYQYIMNRIQPENFEFFVPTLPNDFFKTWIDDTGWWLYPKVRIAPVFTHPNRLMYAFQSETSFNQDTRANTAYQEVCKEVDKDYEANSEGSKEIWTVPVRFRLKFKCLTNEKDLLWEVQSFPNNHISVDKFGGQQWFSCLVVCVTSVEQPKSTNKGGRRIVEAGDSLDTLQGFGTPTNSGMDTGS